MKMVSFLIFCSFFGIGFAIFGHCPGPYPASTGSLERNAAEFWPNDEVALSEDGKRYITQNSMQPKGGIDGLFFRCYFFTCGKNFFPHGIWVTGANNRPLMGCENHQCVDPKTIKCRKTIEKGACLGKNEWVAGFIERKNGTSEWLEVECCETSAPIEPIFVRALDDASWYNHELHIKNETLIAMEYIKEIKKVKNIHGGSQFTATVYRMKCQSFNTSDVPDIHNPEEFLVDENGIGKFENDMKQCDREEDLHIMQISWDKNIPTRHCYAPACINPEKIKCQKSVKIEECSESNQWVADFTKFQNETLSEVECCEFEGGTFNETFWKFENFTMPDFKVKIYNDLNEISSKPIMISYFNNITFDENFENGTLYYVSYYNVKCEGPVSPVLPPGYTQYFTDLMKRIQNSVSQKVLENPDLARNKTDSRAFFNQMFGSMKGNNRTKSIKKIDDGTTKLFLKKQPKEFREIPNPFKQLED